MARAPVHASHLCLPPTTLDLCQWGVRRHGKPCPKTRQLGDRTREAKAIGLVNHVVPAGQARAKALEIAATIADNGPIAVRQAKKAVNRGGETDLETGMILAIEAYNNTVTTDDRLEGVRAFNEKRKPRFTGK